MEALLAYVPFVLFALLCPLMMLFMHGGKGHDGSHRQNDAAAQPRPSAPPPSDKVRP